jgi:tetratricopeptide (TPR) repeat protein/TolB-like protein/predicted Ser/Thr protein kinase
MIGKKVSHYRILEKIGEGGMGEVYLAQDDKLHRQVALKFLPEHLTRDQTRKQRFLQEARAAAAIEHPHIGAIYDVDEAEGRVFMAMEYVRGQSFREAIAGGELSARKSIELGIQIAEGLAKAHERGVVHRDLKPDNVVLAEDGYAKVIDFGLAKLLEPLTKPGAPPTDAEEETWIKTQEGLVLGTVAYMSPEQARGASVDHRSDVFSFGTLLYEMLSGKSPFRRASVFDTLAAVIKESPPPIVLEGAPLDIHRILRKCQAKDPGERYQSMRDLAIDLRAAREEIGSTARAAVVGAEERKFPWKWAAVVAAVVGAAAIGFSLLGGDRAPPGIGAAGRPAVAVMYFEDHTGADEIRWLSTGLPDMLLTGLAQTPGLDVVSSQRIYEILKEVGQENVEAIDKSLTAEVARRSGAGAVVVGSIYKAGEDIRIDVQLQDVETGRLLGAESVRGADVFPLVDDLTGRIRARLELGDRPVGRSLAEVTTDSLEAYRLYTEGWKARHNVRNRDARVLFEKAVAIDPSFAMAYFALWQVTGALGETTQANAYRERVMENLGRLPERQRLMVEALYAASAEDNVGKAAEKLQVLIAQYPDEERAYDHLVHIYGGSNELDRQLELLARWSQAFPGPGSGHLHNHYGYALLEKGLYADAIREFEAYARVSPEEPNPHDSLGEMYVVTGRPEKALENYARALTLDPSFASAHLGRTVAYGMLGRYDDALSEAEMLGALGERGNLPVASNYFLQAFTSSRVGRYREAEEYLERGSQRAERVENAPDQVAMRLLAALLGIVKGDYETALQETDRALSMIPDVPQELVRNEQSVLAHLLSGVAEVRAGRLEGARRHLEAQREIYDGEDLSQNWYHHALAGEIALAEGELAEAENAFLAGEPQPRMWFDLVDTPGSLFANNLPFRDGLARVKKARGDLAGAIGIYQKLNTAGPRSMWIAMLEPRYVLETARLLDQTGASETAREEYERFLELWSDADPGLSELEEARAYAAKQ